MHKVNLNLRENDILSMPVSCKVSSDIAKFLLSRLTVSVSGLLRTDILNLSDANSLLVTRDFHLANIPKAGCHSNDPYWVAQVCETLIKRTNAESVGSCIRDIDQFWGGLENTEPILAKLRS